jgi:hypothetical protein
MITRLLTDDDGELCFAYFNYVVPQGQPHTLDEVEVLSEGCGARSIGRAGVVIPDPL